MDNIVEFPAQAHEEVKAAREILFEELFHKVNKQNDNLVDMVEKQITQNNELTKMLDGQLELNARLCKALERAYL